MGKRYRKAFVLCTVLALTASVFVGCSNKENNEPPTQNAASTQSQEQGDNASTAPANEPAVAETPYPASMTYWSELNPSVAAIGTSLNDVAAVQELEKRTGTKIEFQHTPSDGHAGEQLNLILASGELPDVIYYNWLWVPKGPDNAIKEGRILRLNELIEQNAPNLTKFLNEHPDFKKQLVSDEGNIYVMPYFRGDPYLVTYSGPMIRQDWLEKLGFAMPTTMDEWENALKAFRDKDPNGNGEKDEIPFFLTNWLIDATNSFVGAYGTTYGFFQDGGQVKFGPIQPGFKDYLATMARWYKEGLIDKDYAAPDGNLVNANILNDKIGSLMGYGSQVGKFEGEPANPDFNLAGAPFPSLTTGQPSEFGQKDSFFNGTGAAISANAKNPEQIVKFLDYAYSEEGQLLFNFGIDGQSYSQVEGYPTYSESVTKNPDGLPFGQALAKYALAAAGGFPFIQDKRYYEQFAGKPVQKEAIQIWMQPKNDKLLPPVTLTAEEGDQVGSIMNDVWTYRDEMINKFIMGAEPIENFDKFVETIQGMGIEQAVNIYQAALDRYNKR